MPTLSQLGVALGGIYAIENFNITFKVFFLYILRSYNSL